MRLHFLFFCANWWRVIEQTLLRGITLHNLACLFSAQPVEAFFILRPIAGTAHVWGKVAGCRAGWLGGVDTGWHTAGVAMGGERRPCYDRLGHGKLLCAVLCCAYIRYTQTDISRAKRGDVQMSQSKPVPHRASHCIFDWGSGRGSTMGHGFLICGEVLCVGKAHKTKVIPLPY